MPSGTIFTLLALILSFVITYRAVPTIILIARSKGFTDEPDEDRKIHRETTPTLGGVALFGGFLVSYSIWIWNYSPAYLPALFASMSIIFFFGLKDDVLNINCYHKLLGQVLAASLVVFLGGIVIPGIDGLFGITSFPYYTGEVFTVFAIVIAVNAYNLIDGIDGLAGLISILGASIFGSWFLAGGHYAEAILSFSLVGALIGFTFHNYEPAKIFMGDTGSQMTGFIMVIAGFRLIQLNPVTSGFMLDAPAVFVFSVMIIPLFDTLRVIVLRLRKGISPMKADRKHIHHNLLRLGLRHSRITMYLFSFNIVIVYASLVINSWEVHLYFVTVILMAASILPLMNRLIIYKRLRIIRQLQRRNIQLERKKGGDASPNTGSRMKFNFNRKLHRLSSPTEVFK